MTGYLTGLRDGDEGVFREVFDLYTPVLLRVVSLYTPSWAVAEEVAQDTWIEVIRGIDGFEGRSSLKTWICGIGINLARRRSSVETRSIPMDMPTTDQYVGLPGERFQSDGIHAGHWAVFPSRWVLPEDQMLASELRGALSRALAGLPRPQCVVVTLRDVEGWSASEVSQMLGLTPSNQRVLLHRGRMTMRTVLERYLGD